MNHIQSYPSFSRYIAPLFVVAMLAVSANAQAWSISIGNGVKGSGKQIEESRAVAAFEKIEVKGSTDVEIRQGSKTGATVIADDNIAPLIRTRVVGDTLIIDTDKSYHSKLKTRVVVDVISLTGIALTGSGDVIVGSLKANALDVGLAGSGDIAFSALTAESLSMSISGSGDFRASGSVKAQSFAISGSGDVRAESLEGARVNVKISGSGDARVWAKEALAASISGSGDIRYKGQPASLTKSVIGSGEISPIQNININF